METGRGRAPAPTETQAQQGERPRNATISAFFLKNKTLRPGFEPGVLSDRFSGFLPDFETDAVPDCAT